MTFLNSFKKHPVLKFLASIRITVICLSILFLLTFFGTLAQVTQGLYAAQEQYFHSFYFMAYDVIPLPGGQLVMWVLFINLCAATITRFVLSWRYLGIWITHIGLLLYFVAAYVTFQQTVESNLTLIPGETKNVSSAYHDWELSIWTTPDSPEQKAVTAVPDDMMKHGRTIDLPDHPVTIFIHTYFTNAQAYTAGPEEDITDALNASDIKFLEPVKVNTEPEQNIPGVVFNIRFENGGSSDIILYGAENKPTVISVAGKDYYMQLRRQRRPLPVTVTLTKFEKEFHPGTQTPKSFHSWATVEHQGVSRDVEIYMNHPYRFKDLTFYQASYGVDAVGREFSTFAVVENSGRLLPYIASGVTFVGLCVHFLIMAFNAKTRNVKRT